MRHTQPVLVYIQSSSNNNACSSAPCASYTFVSVAEAEYILDYYQNYHYTPVTNYEYGVAYWGVAGETIESYLRFIRFDANPFAGAANRAGINWSGTSGGAGSGK